MTFAVDLFDIAVPITGMVAAVAATCAYVVTVARQVSHWRQAEQGRNSAVDCFVHDWTARGLNPEGALQEAAAYRAVVDTHTAAIADATRRLADGEARQKQQAEQAARTEHALEQLNDRFDDVDTLLHTLVETQR